MRVRRVLARVVFSMGLTTLIATSDDDSDGGEWSKALSQSASLHSEGQGDDKIIRIIVSRSDAIAQLSLSGHVSLAATASRAASDVRIDWLWPSAEDGGTRAVPDAGLSTVASMVRFSHGFTVLNVERSLDLVPCADGRECVKVQEAHIHADSPEPYDLTLEVGVRVQGSESDGMPPGMFSLAVEVLDAP